MPSVTNNNDNNTLILKTTLLLVAVTINALEFFLPRIPFLPWLKPGIANCVTLFWIIRYGGKDALLFSLLRVWLVGFYFGFSFITIFLSLSGGILSTCAMAIAWYILGRKKFLGTVGTAIIGALFHNFGQLIAVFYLLAYNVYLFYQVPFMIIASIFFGGLVGVLVPPLSHLVDYLFTKNHDVNLLLPENTPNSRAYTLVSILLIFLSFSLMFITNSLLLILVALTITLAVQIITAGKIGTIFLPFRRFWMLFLFVACFHLFPAYGKKIEWLPFLSIDGVYRTLIQWLRLFSWLQLSLLLTHFQFHTVLFKTLSFFFKTHTFTFYAGLLAVEDFPEVFDLMRKRVAKEFRFMLRHPVTTSKQVLNQTFKDIADYIIEHHRETILNEKNK